MHEKTWLYKNAQLEEACPNGCVIAFNPTRSPLLLRQVEAIAKELAYDYRVYDNHRTPQKILEASDLAYQIGYEDLIILTETNLLNQTEKLVKNYFDFTNIQAFSEVVSSAPTTVLQESFANRQPLREGAPAPASVVAKAPPQGNALLLVAALNANPPVKGTGELIQEILSLEGNAASYVSKYLPNFTSWDKRTVYVRIYLRAPAAQNSLASDLRIQLLANSGLMGLYNQGGVGAMKTRPPLVANLAPEGLWIPGNRRSSPGTKINEFMDGMGVGGTIVFAPPSQVSAVAQEFKIATVAPLNTNFQDEPRSDLIALSVTLSNEYSIKNIANKADQAKPLNPINPTMGDNFILQWLHIGMKTGGSSSEWELKKGDEVTKNSKGYFERIWDALPTGDKEFLKNVGSGTGIGDIVSIVNNTRKILKAANPIQGKNKMSAEAQEKIKKMEQELGFGVAEVINDPRFQQLKKEFDLAD